MIWISGTECFKLDFLIRISAIHIVIINLKAFYFETVSHISLYFIQMTYKDLVPTLKKTPNLHSFQQECAV